MTGPFDDASRITGYAETALRQVPGLADLYRMAVILLGEAAGPGGRILVLGAGGGMEVEALTDARPDWAVVGVDPSAAMLDLARARLGPRAAGVEWVTGLIDDAPDGPFDGATCILTLHFLPRPARLATLRAIRSRLRPGARLVTAHHSFPLDQGRWLDRFGLFGAALGTDPDAARARVRALGDHLPVLTPEEDAALLAEAGFNGIDLIYAGLTFRGWVCLAGSG